MGVAAKIFAGRKIYKPGIYSRSIYPPQAGNVGVLSNVVCVVGSAKGGIPYNAADVADEDKINVYTSVTECLNEMVGGEAYYMCEFFLTPTKDETLAKPAQVLFVRVNPAVQAQSVIKDALNNDIIELKTRRYGAIANQICRQIVAGSDKGYKITVKYAGQTVAQKDNIYKDVMTIRYIGSGTACELTINGTKLTTTVTGATGEDLDITLSEYPTIEKLVDYINSQAVYNCVMLASGDTASNTMDYVTALDITTQQTITANVQAVIDFFNNETNEVVAKLVGDRTTLAYDANFVYMQGGSDGTITNADWIGAFALLEKIQVNHILVASGDATVHAIADAHCQKMSDVVNKRNRTWAAGAALNTNKATRIAEAKALNSARAIYFATPFYRIDYVNGGEKRLFDPFYGAAFDAGIRYANAVTISSTFKKPNILGTSEKYTNADIDEYIANGCTIMGMSESGQYEIIHCVSTYQSANLILNLPSMLRTCDFITLDSQVKIREQIAALDRAPNSLVIKSIENYLTSNLLPYYRDNGYLTDDPNTGAKAFSDIEFRVEGDAFYFSFTGIVPAPLHYGFITQRFTIVG